MHLFSRTSYVQERQGRKCARPAIQIVLRARRYLVPLLLQAGTGRNMQRGVGEHTFTRESQHGQAGCSVNIHLLSVEQESEEDLPASPDPSAQRQAWDEVKLVR